MLQAKFPGTLNLRVNLAAKKRRNVALDELVEDHDPEQKGQIGD
jgi:CTP-dependent riboflavin kinase